MHLGHDHAFGPVHDERAVRRHEGHVAHVDVLLLDVLDRLRACIRIHIEHDEAKRHLERRRERHAAGAALVDVEFRLFEFIFDEFEQGRAGKIRDREDGFEDGLKPFVGAPAFGFVDEQELIIGGLLDLDQVGHFGDFADVTEELADPFPACERLRHVAPRTFRAAEHRSGRSPDHRRKRTAHQSDPPRRLHLGLASSRGPVGAAARPPLLVAVGSHQVFVTGVGRLSSETRDHWKNAGKVPRKIPGTDKVSRNARGVPRDHA